jgi:ribonuclease D
MPGKECEPVAEGTTSPAEQIITQPEDLSACCAHLAASGRFGFDTEFVGEDTYHPHLCLVQVATDDRLYLIDPLTVGPLDSFWQLVIDPNLLVVVHAGREEVRLCQHWTGKPPANLFDLQIAAALIGLNYPMGHAALVNQLLGIHLAKGETLTEWRERPLTRRQIRYAFDDVRYLLPLWNKMSERLEKLGRSDWAREEFSRLAQVAAPVETESEKWRKLRGLGTLDRRRLALARELFHWRETTAARTNRPARTIIRDDLIIEIARRNPRQKEDLNVMRGLPRRDHAAILEVVERASNLPMEECPMMSGREQDPPQVAFVAALLGAVLGDRCLRGQLMPNFVATSNDVKLLARAAAQGQPPPAESQLSQGWRARHILPELLAVLEGRRTVRIVDPTAETPFAVEDRS